MLLYSLYCFVMKSSRNNVIKFESYFGLIYPLTLWTSICYKLNNINSTQAADTYSELNGRVNVNGNHFFRYNLIIFSGIE